MSEQNKGHLTMGLPRASGKRRWSGEDGGEEVPSKVMCTSPPHALCAEDVLHHPTLTHANATTPTIECELTTPVDVHEVTTSLNEDDTTSSSTSSSTGPAAAPTTTHHHDDTFTESDDDESLDERDDFIDDEEDKDSGFIDSNSIDNSSDDEAETRVIPELPVSSSPLPTTSTLTTITCTSTITPTSTITTVTSTITSFSTIVTSTTTSSSTPSVSSSLQLSLSRVLPPAIPVTTSVTSPAAPQMACPPTTIVVPTPQYPAAVTPPPDCLMSGATTTEVSAAAGSCVVEDRVTAPLVSEASVTTVTAAQTGTVVTATYQGAVTSPAYDPHSYPYSPEYPARPATPAWGSCNFYDGSQPHTSKYMEIAPSKTGGTAQSIQCDENGKSYLELGSASPYTHTYSSECGSYTTSPSSYPSQQPYNQTYTSSTTYGQPSTYYNRQSYSPNPYNVYPGTDGYGGFENESGCGYGYGVAGYGGVRGAVPRGPQRCMSPYCDPTRGAARPSCYHQQRLSVLNVSMYKLNRFRQFPEPNLHRSVLICNTLRHIERELEAEGVSVASLLAHSHAHAAHPHLQAPSPPPAGAPCPEPMPSSPPASPAPSEGPLPPMHTQLVGSPLAAPVALPPSTPVTPPPPPPSATHYTTAGPTVQYSSTQYHDHDHHATYDTREAPHLRSYQSLATTSHHSDASDNSSSEHEDGGDGEEPATSSGVRASHSPTEERTDAINWCSVLSLSSQTDLDSMNNNEYGEWSGEAGPDLDYVRAEDGSWKLPSLSADDVLKSFPEASKRLEANEDLDSIINVLVGS